MEVVGGPYRNSEDGELTEAGAHLGTHPLLAAECGHLLSDLEVLEG